MKKWLRHRYRLYRRKVNRFLSSPAGKRFTKFATYGIQVLIIGVIIYQLTVIGWSKVLHSLPTTPWFYVLFLVIYSLLPIADTIAYRILWDIPHKRSIFIFIKKRIFNKDLMGYSGELVLMQWAVKQLNLSGKQAFKDIRDVNIISSAASTFSALGVLAVLILTDQIRAFSYVFDESLFRGANLLEYVLAAVIILIVIGVLYRFRSYFYDLPALVSLKIFSIHSVRMLLVYAAQILQWHLVLPDISLDLWFTFLTVNILTSRIPFIPSNELVATGANIELAQVLKAPVAGVSGIFLVHNVLDKLVNLIFYLYFSVEEPEKDIINP